MTNCELRDTADVELYFYGEFDPVDRARVEGHLRGCEACRMRLEDLQAIRRALALRPVVDAPPAGDWSGFMRRLDSAIERAGAVREPPIATRERGNHKNLIAIAATLALVSIGVLMAMRFEPAAEISVAVKTPVTASVRPGPAVTTATPGRPVTRDQPSAACAAVCS